MTPRGMFLASVYLLTGMAKETIFCLGSGIGS